MTIPKYLLGVFAILTVVSCIPTSPLTPRQQSAYDFRGCSIEQQTSIDNMLDDVQELARAATGPSEASNAGQDWYKAWWGTNDGKMLQDEKINTRFEKLAAFKKRLGTGTTFACEPNAFCCTQGVFTGGTVACQNNRGDQDIHLCLPFWTFNPERIGSLGKQDRPISLKLDQWRSRPSILLHELTHHLFKTFDQVWYPDGVKNVAYGHVHDLEYTQYNPAGARLNADHYERFATAAYFGNGDVSIFATDPREVTSGPHY